MPAPQIAKISTFTARMASVAMLIRWALPLSTQSMERIPVLMDTTMGLQDLKEGLTNLAAIKPIKCSKDVHLL